MQSYTRVRVHLLLHPQSAYDGWKLNRRPPQVGDVGTFIQMLSAPGLSDRYVGEMTDPGGDPIWLADFVAEEIEDIEANRF